MPNSPGPRLLSGTYGSPTPGSRARSSNSASRPLIGRRNGTGNPFGTTPSLDGSRTLMSPPESSTIGQSSRSRRITSSPLRLRRRLTYSGALLVPESPAGHGLRLDLTPTPRTRAPSSGVVTAVNNMSLSMNSVEALTLPIYSDGLIATPLPSRRRAQLQYLGPLGSGLPATWRPRIGSPVLTSQRAQHYYDDSELRTSLLHW